LNSNAEIQRVQKGLITKSCLLQKVVDFGSERSVSVPALIWYLGPIGNLLTGLTFASTLSDKKRREDGLVYVFEFFAAVPDRDRVLIDVQKHRATSADAAAHRARTIIKNVVLDGRVANLCVIKDQMGGLIREVTIDAHHAPKATAQVA
jgi:hypothetical protein